MGGISPHVQGLLSGQVGGTALVDLLESSVSQSVSGTDSDVVVVLILGDPIGIIECLGQVTTFVTVASLSNEQQLHRPDATTSSDVPRLTARLPVEELLSVRELEVLAMMATGCTNAEIAAKLIIAKTTVQSHVQHILTKLVVRNRTEAAARYLGD